MSLRAPLLTGNRNQLSAERGEAVRSRLIALTLTVVVLLTAGHLAVQAADRAVPVPSTLASIDAAAAAGVLTRDEAALNKVYRVFDRSLLDPDLVVEGDLPLKNATLLIASILDDAGVSADVKETLREYLDAPLDGRAEYISPSGHFKLTYSTGGGSGVPPDDDNSNGTPDFVEWCADYLDTTWQVEITNLGFMAPDKIDGYYQVSFQNMSAYGYCTVDSGTTRIVLHNDYLGFPPNDDPEGDQKGAAKATCAHEFKHASQYTNSGWSEGGWVEVDATWAEDIVFPLVNDYLTFVDTSGSPLNNPELSLDDGGSGSYDDCIWQHYMSGTWGNQIIVDLWSLRRTYPGWDMLTSYNVNLGDYGSGLSEVMAAWTPWNFLTGTRAEDGYGYDDADGLRTCSAWISVAGLGVESTGAVPHLATRYVHHFSLSGLSDYPKVTFDGNDGTDFRPQIVVKKTDDTLVFDAVTLDAQSDGEKTLDIPFSQISEIGLAFPNCERIGLSVEFTYQLLSAPDTGVDDTAGLNRTQMHPVFPNPFNPRTVIRFELGSALPVDLRIVTADGRVVRQLLSGEVRGPGEQDVVFDGTDADGNDLPGGVYFAELATGGSARHLAKMVLLK